MLRASLCSMTFMVASVLGLQAPIPGYGVVDIVWSVNAYGNGTLVNIAGPVEHVYNQLEKINPSILINVTAPPPPANATNHDTIILSQDLGDAVHCGPGPYNWSTAYLDKIKDGISYLRGVPGKPVNGPGPGKCGRVSCSWKSAIWWCNDNKTPKQLDSFGAIADCAQSICDTCQNPDPWDHNNIVGQNFMPGDWNCIVRYDNDSC